MWATTTGSRILIGAEADWVRGCLGMLVDDLVSEMRDGEAQWFSGIDWFDQWDASQRLWLLEHVTGMLLGVQSSPPAAIWDATVDAVFGLGTELVLLEIESQDFRSTRSWRQSIWRAWRSQNRRRPPFAIESETVSDWLKLIDEVSAAILGVRLYQKAESMRDGDFRRLQRFLQERGLPEDYLSRMPPLVSIDRAQLSIDRIQRVVFSDE